MEPNRFDALTRSLAAPKTRRGLLGTLAALGAGLLGARAAEAQTSCGNVICYNRTTRTVDVACGPGCVCCVYPNGNSRCTPPGGCTGTVVSPTTTTTAPPVTTTAAPTTTTTAAPTCLPLGDTSCDESGFDDCCPGTICANNLNCGGGFNCGYDRGEGPCANQCDCAAAFMTCSAGICCVGIGTGCDRDIECCGALVCQGSGGTCCIDSGNSCELDNQCCSGDCVAFECV